MIPGKRVGETKCEKIPVDICGKGCVTREGKQVRMWNQFDDLILTMHSVFRSVMRSRWTLW